MFVRSISYYTQALAPKYMKIREVKDLVRKIRNHRQWSERAMADRYIKRRLEAILTNYQLNKQI